MEFLFILLLLIVGIRALGPPKLIAQSPDEVWFEPSATEDFVEAKLTLKCEASGNPEK